MMKYILKNMAVTVTGLLLLTGLMCCKKEGALEPVNQSPLYELPQGNHPYDQQIVQLHAKYGTYFLYKFDSVTYGYNIISYLPAAAQQGNEAYIQQSLDFINSQCLNFYSETFKQATMPLKFILAATMDSVVSFTTAGVLGTQYKLSPSVTKFCAGVSTLIFGWADSTLVELTPEQVKGIRGYLNRAYFDRALQGGSLTVPAPFEALQPSVGYGQIPTLGIQYQYGVIESGGLNLSKDFLSYINAITGNSKATLEATILSPATDVNGLIRKKYNALIEYYKTNYGFDLQAIGDHS